ncbi:MAG TPA: helix-turn-helix domain-containing protein [Tepidisphaeraceae bacterium]|jgi:DNA-binding XRE family transcriptional regulator|nr:helix-turn-helix domain-containing protein [Tepidisphaeraceae bacterium]
MKVVPNYSAEDHEESLSNTMKFSDGRTVAVEVPGRMVVRDRAGETAFTPDGVRFLDHLRALFMPLDRAPSPAFIRRLREALGMSQHAFGVKVGVNKPTVARREWGKLTPSKKSIRAIQSIRAAAVRRGVSLGN